jgi:O-antigen/teichoic acid export membrane protein
MSTRVVSLFARYAQPEMTGSSLRLSALAVQAGLVRMLGPLSSFALAVLLARSLGAAGSGEFYTTLTLVMALATFAKFGLETALQRFIGTANAAGDQANVTSFYYESLAISAWLALAIAVLCVVLATPISGLLFNDTAPATLLRILGVAILPFTLLGINAATLKALGKPVLGGFFEAAAWPLLTLCLVAVTKTTFTDYVQVIAGISLLATSSAALLAQLAVRSILPSDIQPQPIDLRPMFSSCLSLTAVEVANYVLLWLPLLLLPALASTAEAGLFNVSHRLAAQLGLLLLVFASITSPRFAAHYQTGRHAEMAALAGRATRSMMVLALPPVIILLGWSEQILAIFGNEFVAARSSLYILLAGQLINLATGPVGYLLAMTGHEKELRNTVFITTILMLPMGMLLIPAHGSEGAAATASLALVFHNILCSRQVVKHLGLPMFIAFAR